MEPFGTACDLASGPAPWFWHLWHGLTCSNWLLTHSQEPQEDNRYSLWPHCARHQHQVPTLSVPNTWSRAAMHWQDWQCKLLQMLLALNPTWVPAYACQCPAASHHLLQIVFRLSQEDSWLPLCAAARIWEQILAAVWSRMSWLGNTTEGFMQIV